MKMQPPKQGRGTLTEPPRGAAWVAQTGGACNVHQHYALRQGLANSTPLAIAQEQQSLEWAQEKLFRFSAFSGFFISQLSSQWRTFPVSEPGCRLECPFLAARPAYQPHPRWFLQDYSSQHPSCLQSRGNNSEESSRHSLLRSKDACRCKHWMLCCRWLLDGSSRYGR